MLNSLLLGRALGLPVSRESNAVIHRLGVKEVVSASSPKVGSFFVAVVQLLSVVCFCWLRGGFILRKIK